MKTMLFSCKRAKNLKLIGMLLYLRFTFGHCDDNADEDQINYYEEVITTGINETYRGDLPTSAEAYRPKNNLIEDFGTYDFVVVGSGPGGSVVANRLSEIRQWSVLLIEAGGPESDFTDIPKMYYYLLGSKFNWNFNTTRQTNACLGMADQVCPMPRGKALGGSSAISALIYSRGNKNDYDKWAKQGNTGWSYHDVLPYFIKSENSQIKGDPGYHGRDGYWNVKYYRPIIDKRVNAFVEGGRLAYKANGTDYNGKAELGTFYTQFNSINQFRQSAYKAFLNPIKERPNLKILTHSYTTKIVVNSVTKTANGIQFTRNGKTYFVKARKEVILSAGVINSPQILMLSGIGPKQHLRKKGIQVIHDLPVGKTLFDHHLFYGAYVTTNSSEPVLSLRENIKQFLKGYGPLTIALNCQGIGFYKTKFENDYSNYPDIELVFNPLAGFTNSIRRTLTVTEEVYQALYKNLIPTITVKVYIFVLTSRSLGEISLHSKDAFKYPKIHANYLNNDDDFERMYKGLKIIEDILKTEPLQKINASLVYADYPQCRDFKMGSKGYWICAFRLLTASGARQTGTCRMGPNSTNSVVDNRAKVHGIHNLRVVDSSIIPFSIAAHTGASTVMVGERVSDFIKLDHGLSIDPITNVVDD